MTFDKWQFDKKLYFTCNWILPIILLIFNMEHVSYQSPFMTYSRLSDKRAGWNKRPAQNASFKEAIERVYKCSKTNIKMVIQEKI